MGLRGGATGHAGPPSAGGPGALERGGVDRGRHPDAPAL